MNQSQQQSLDVKGKYYILNLAGGLGARIIQTCFIRSLITKRKKDKNSYPILVIDNTIIEVLIIVFHNTTQIIFSL